MSDAPVHAEKPWLKVVAELERFDDDPVSTARAIRDAVIAEIRLSARSKEGATG